MKTINASKVTVFFRDENGERVELEANAMIEQLVAKNLVDAREVYVDGKPIAIELKCTPAVSAVASMWRDYLESLKQLVRKRIAERFERPTLEDAAGVLAEVMREEVEAGFEFSDEQLERIAGVLEDYG